MPPSLFKGNYRLEYDVSVSSLRIYGGVNYLDLKLPPFGGANCVYLYSVYLRISRDF